MGKNRETITRSKRSELKGIAGAALFLVGNEESATRGGARRGKIRERGPCSSCSFDLNSRDATERQLSRSLRNGINENTTRLKC